MSSPVARAAVDFLSLCGAFVSLVVFSTPVALPSHHLFDLLASDLVVVRVGLPGPRFLSHSG